MTFRFKQFTGIGALGIALLSGGCDLGCENEVRDILLAPTGALAVVVFERSCGATVGFNTQVSIVRSGNKPNGPGNALILDGKVPLTIRWISEREIVVEGASGPKSFKRESSVVGVSIVYE